MKTLDSLDIQIECCYATKTRLMGVVAGFIIYAVHSTRYAEYYHVEFEEYGVDRFDQLENPTDFQIQQLKLEVFGGLGGPLVPISSEQLIQLLLAGNGINSESEEFADALARSKWLEALNKAEPQSQSLRFNPQVFLSAVEAVSEDLRSPFELIHYFLMRYFGHDDIYLRYAPLVEIVANLEPEQLEQLEERASLMRNQLERLEENRYRFSALVLQGSEDYSVVEGELAVEEGLIEAFEITALAEVTDLEAALMLKKKEFIYLYDVDNEALESLLTHDHKYLSITLYPNGRLYTCYRPHNDHVNAKVFYLNGDVEAFLYFTDSNQLLLVADDLRAMLKWDDLLVNRFGADLDKYEEWEFESPMLYDFIDSGVVDFDDFLK